jgi:hypothetical protein
MLLRQKPHLERTSGARAYPLNCARRWMEKWQFHMRILLDIIGQTFRTLWAHKLRSFLTMFGIAWGVGSLLLLVGLGEGFRSGNQKQLNTMGENIVWVNGGWWCRSRAAIRGRDNIG